jgi:hypothetical protein
MGAVPPLFSQNGVPECLYNAYTNLTAGLYNAYTAVKQQ